jgi:bifunctional DNA-binding transcriptional regulator/antitoxin component of YhaV-PrlF toxin-antitoxin module
MRLGGVLNNTNPIQKKVSFGTVSLQQLRRIALPALLTENMNLSEGDELAIWFDPDCKAAVLVKVDRADHLVRKSAKKAPSR